MTPDDRTTGTAPTTGAADGETDGARALRGADRAPPARSTPLDVSAPRPEGPWPLTGCSPAWTGSAFTGFTRCPGRGRHGQGAGRRLRAIADAAPEGTSVSSPASRRPAARRVAAGLLRFLAAAPRRTSLSVHVARLGLGAAVATLTLAAA